MIAKNSKPEMAPRLAHSTSQVRIYMSLGSSRNNESVYCSKCGSSNSDSLWLLSNLTHVLDQLRPTVRERVFIFCQQDLRHDSTAQWDP